MLMLHGKMRRDDRIIKVIAAFRDGEYMLIAPRGGDLVLTFLTAHVSSVSADHVGVARVCIRCAAALV